MGLSGTTRQARQLSLAFSFIMKHVMKEKFIEGTDERYSITEDGRVFSNYRIVYSCHTFRKKYERKEKKVNKNGMIELADKQFSIRTIQFKNLGYNFCKKCKNRMYVYRYQGICEDCIKQKRIKSDSEYKKRNREKLRESLRSYRKRNHEKCVELYQNLNARNRDNLTRAYVAGSLNISIKDLSEELYQHHRNLILLKRELTEKHGISIQKLNKRS